jgi:hypothetical protein
LSQQIALAGLKSDHGLGTTFRELVAASFDEVAANAEPKLSTTIHKVHLVALKANFELYLNRTLCAIWVAKLSELAREFPQTRPPFP